MSRPSLRRPGRGPGSASPTSSTVAAAAEVAARLGLPGTPERQSAGTTNGVFACGPVVLIVHPVGTDPALVSARLRLGRVVSAYAPFVVPRTDPDEPEEAGGHLVTVWERIATAPRAPDPEALGRAVRAFHDVPLEQLEAEGVELRPSLALGSVTLEVGRLRAEGRLDRGSARVLVEVAARLGSELGQAEPTPDVLLHGDLHAPNVLVEADTSRVVLCDLDEVGRGPADLDLGFVVDPCRPLLADASARAAFERGYAGPLPTPERARTAARAAHLRRTVRALATGGEDARSRFYDRVRVTSWADMLENWTLDLHPVVTQSRAQQALRAIRPRPSGDR